MSYEAGKGHRACWKCATHYPPEVKVCTRCGVHLDTGEPEPDTYDEVHTDRYLDWRWTPSRIASLVVWALWWLFAIRRGGMTYRLPLGQLLAIVMIWFPDALTGLSAATLRGEMRYPTQPRIVAFCGWALLVGPVLLLAWYRSLV
jgi:hypothetical protein